MAEIIFMARIFTGHEYFCHVMNIPAMARIFMTWQKYSAEIIAVYQLE
jgi:hypothetical protein